MMDASGPGQGWPSQRFRLCSAVTGCCFSHRQVTLEHARHVQVLWWATKADTAPKPKVFSRPWEMRFPYKRKGKCTTSASFASLTWSMGPRGSPRPIPTGLHPADCPSLMSWPCWQGEEARG